jgi:hypothetical protein
LCWLQDPSEINGDNLNNVRLEASRYLKNKRREYMKDKINELATNSKNKNIGDLYRGINEFKRGYQPRSNLVKDENGDLLADSHSILNLWKNYFSQLLNWKGCRRNWSWHTLFDCWVTAMAFLLNSLLIT